MSGGIQNDLPISLGLVAQQGQLSPNLPEIEKDGSTAGEVIHDFVFSSIGGDFRLPVEADIVAVAHSTYLVHVESEQVNLFKTHVKCNNQALRNHRWHRHHPLGYVRFGLPQSDGVVAGGNVAASCGERGSGFYDAAGILPEEKMRVGGKGIVHLVDPIDPVLVVFGWMKFRHHHMVAGLDGRDVGVHIEMVLGHHHLTGQLLQIIFFYRESAPKDKAAFAFVLVAKSLVGEKDQVWYHIRQAHQGVNGCFSDKKGCVHLVAKVLYSTNGGLPLLQKGSF